MKSVLVLLVTNREPKNETKRSVQALTQSGARFLQVRGSSDVCQARNSALSKACDWLRSDPCDVVLMVDDDMVFTVDAAQMLVDGARRTGQACSGAYCVRPEDNMAMGHTRMAGGLWKGAGKFEDGTPKWLMGLGFLAVPAAMLLELERSSSSYETNGVVFTEFVWSQAVNGQWLAEDMRFCQRLGGVRLLPAEAGHLKEMALWPDRVTMKEIERLSLPPEVAPHEPEKAQPEGD
jgi:hypothetical protein